jgi:hypothetical protein
MIMPGLPETQGSVETPDVVAAASGALAATRWPPATYVPTRQQAQTHLQPAANAAP